MTIKDIAKMAGVSTATVSRALNGGTGVNEDTKKRILQICNDFGYQPNELARGLASQKTYTVGVVVADIINSYWPVVFRGIEDVMSQYGYTIVFFNTDYDAQKEHNALQHLRNGRLDGLIISMSNYVTDECMALVNMNYPLVMVGQMLDEVKCPKVGCNNFSSAYTMTEYLLKAGHRKIAHVAGHFETKTGLQRLNGYKTAMQDYGIEIDPSWIISTDYFETNATSKTKALLKEGLDVTALFAANDALAAGCYRAIMELGLRIPEDISVAGHDDIEISSLIHPQLTTMHQQRRKIGQTAACKLLTAMEGHEVKEDIVIVPTTLVERTSVRRLNE